jgi:hypothetical protein
MPVADFYAIGAKMDAGDSAHVPRQHFSALPFASVMDCVSILTLHLIILLGYKEGVSCMSCIATLGHAILICKIQHYLVKYVFP